MSREIDQKVLLITLAMGIPSYMKVEIRKMKINNVLNDSGEKVSEDSLIEEYSKKLCSKYPNFDLYNVHTECKIQWERHKNFH